MPRAYAKSPTIIRVCFTVIIHGNLRQPALGFCWCKVLQPAYALLMATNAFWLGRTDACQAVFTGSASPFTSLPLSPFPPRFPLEIAPLNTATGSGECCKPSARFGAEPQRKSNLVHFSLKIWHLVASNLLIFLRSNWPVYEFLVNYRKWQWPKRKNYQGWFHVHKSWYIVNIKIIVCQIIGPAAAGYAGPVLTPVQKMLEFSSSQR